MKKTHIKEKKSWSMNGYIALIIIVTLYLFIGYSIFRAIISEEGLVFSKNLSLIILFIIAYVLSASFTVISPNQAKVIIFQGQYLGTIKTNGPQLTVPFTKKIPISLKVKNFNTSKLKVNDVEGNPIEIGAVVVFRVVDTAKALFDVEHYENFVEVQSETAIRYVATQYPYDSYQGDEVTLRGNVVEISEELTKELQERLNIAGVEVIEARLTHLAYSTEIASAMLQRQQAKAILSARKLIVEGAVSMSQEAICQIEESGYDLSTTNRVNLINNLLVSIIADKGVQPTLNVEDQN